MDAFNQHRRSIRWEGYDYGLAGAYFVTVCAARKRAVFGDIRDGVMHLNAYGRIVHECWNALPEHFADVILDEHVIMPNHFHAILLIVPNVGAQHAAPSINAPQAPGAMIGPRTIGLGQRAQHAAPLRVVGGVTPQNVAPGSLGAIMRSFKGAVTRRTNLYRAERGLSPVTVWQRNYFERIIRDEQELNATRRYIFENPINWHLDSENV